MNALTINNDTAIGTWVPRFKDTKEMIAFLRKESEPWRKQQEMELGQEMELEKERKRQLKLQNSFSAKVKRILDSTFSRSASLLKDAKSFASDLKRSSSRHLRIAAGVTWTVCSLIAGAYLENAFVQPHLQKERSSEWHLTPEKESPTHQLHKQVMNHKWLLGDEYFFQEYGKKVYYSEYEDHAKL